MLNVDLYVDYPRLAVLYSGGADSTLLYYLVIANLLKSNQHKTLDLLIVDRHNKPIDRAVNLYNTVKEQIGDNISTLKIITVPESTPNNMQVLRMVEQVQDNYDCILWGVNQYPDDISIRPRSEFTVDFSKYADHPKLKLPFANSKKTDIIDTFIKLGLEHILNNTHSCGNPGPVPCGECFNCRERTWAYKQLGLVPNFGV